MNNVFALIIAIYLAINLYPTIKTVKLTEQKNARKLYQLLAIWFIPFLGGLTISLIHMINPKSGAGSYDVGVGDYGDGDSSGGDG